MCLPPQRLQHFSHTHAEAARKSKGSDSEEDEEQQEEERRNRAAGGSRWGVAPTKVIFFNFISCTSLQTCAQHRFASVFA